LATDEKAEKKSEDKVEEEEEAGVAEDDEKRPEPLPFIDSTKEMKDLCFNPYAGTCLIALLPDVGQEEEFSYTVIEGLLSLAQIKEKYRKSRTPVFPFYAVPAENEVNTYLRKSLRVGKQKVLSSAGAFEIFIVSAKRGWWRRYRSEVGPESGFSVKDIHTWIEHVKSGAGMSPPGQRGKKVKPATDGKPDENADPAAAVADVIDNLSPGVKESGAEDKLPEDEKAEQPIAEGHDEL